MPYGIGRTDLAGRDLTEYLMTLMCEIGKSFKSSSEKEIARKIKEKLCYVVDDCIEAMKKDSTE